MLWSIFMYFIRNKTLSNASVTLLLIALYLYAINAHAALNAFDKPIIHPPIPLYDESDQHVLLSNNPYSPKKSCAGSGCHDYEAITHAYHFEMGRDEAKDDYGAIRGLPHLVSPGYYGGYTCMGGNNQQVLAKKNNTNPAEFADHGSAGWVKTCMSCHTGGGWAEKDRDGIRYDQKKLADINPLDGDYYERVIDPQTGQETIALWDWKKSGVGEADCLFCHVKFSTLELPVDSGLNKALSPRNAREALVEKGYFRQAASAIMEYVKNDQDKHLLTIARTDGQFTLGQNGLPIFNWHADAFDENGRVKLSLLRFPESDNCMECHVTSNTRRGFYGFGEAARATLESEEESDGETAGAGSNFADDYQDDIHKGTKYTADNGEQRTIESCNSCHSSQYFKPFNINVDLDADHNFPKGNSDMDVRNDLDYKPNVKSCEECHINSINAITGPQETLFKTHREAWKTKGYFAGYDEKSLTPITQRHFDTVACQTCHIVGKKDSEQNDLQIMYRFRIAEDGQPKISPYNPRLRYFWKDKTSGRILYQNERNSVFLRGQEANGNLYGDILDPQSQKILGRVTATLNDDEIFYNDPSSYQGYVALKTAYDSLLRIKGYTNPNTTLVWSESNEYVISHNTRRKEEALACRDCHSSTASGDVSQQLSATGILGSSNSKDVIALPDARLVAEGIVTLGLPYFKSQPDGRITQNVADILFETKIDSFMSLLKNSSANEISGGFTEIATTRLLQVVGDELATLIQPNLTDAKSYFFALNKGKPALRNMATAISGNAVNNEIFPTLRASLLILEGIEKSVQEFLEAQSFGQLRSRVFKFDIADQNKNPLTSFFNDSVMFMKVPYKGIQTDLSKINIIMANQQATTIEQIHESDLVFIKPSNDIDDGFVIFKMKETGFFLVADKKVDLR